MIARRNEQLTITTGVIHNNSAMWLHEDIFWGINLDWIAAQQEHGLESDELGYWEETASDTILIGFKECDVNDPDAWWVEEVGDDKRTRV